MILVSINIRGLGSGPKEHALQRVIECVCPDIVLIQETMLCDEKSHEIFSSLMPYWDMYSSDFIGLQGDLLYSWNPKVSNFDAYHSGGGIILDGILNDQDNT